MTETMYPLMEVVWPLIQIYVIRSDPPAAVSLDQMMGHNDLRSWKVRVFNMADHLRSGFHSKLSGIDINGSQLR